MSATRPPAGSRAATGRAEPVDLTGAAPHATDAAAPPVSRTDWTQKRERSNLRALRLMRWIAVSAGRRAARCVLVPIALYFLVFGGTARRASRQYLSRALGRAAGRLDTYRHIHRFAATVLDRVYFMQGRLDRFVLRAPGLELLDASVAHGEGAFLVGAHFGSFEALRALGQVRGERVAMVMYEENARLINATLAAIAPEAHLHTIPLGRLDAMLTLARWLDGGGIAGLLADRTLPGSSSRSKTVEVPFLGRPARFSDGPFRLAAMLRRRVIFMVGLYHGGRHYELRFQPLADFRERAPDGAALERRIEEAVQRYVELLESLCRESPYNWFNFFDFWAPHEAAGADARRAGARVGHGARGE